MEATKLFASPALYFSSSSSTSRQAFLKNSRCQNGNHVRIIGKAGAKPNGSDCWGDLVDENMIVLRKRIKELNIEEGSTKAPQEWTEWEKKYYMNGYNEDVCEAMGLLQNYFMSVRPCLALGTVALVVLSLLMSSGMAVFHVVELVKSI